MMFGSPELWVGETTARRWDDGGPEHVEHRAIVENRGSAEAKDCAAGFKLKGIYHGLSEGRYRFAIDVPGRWIRDDDSTTTPIEDGETVPAEVFRVVAASNDEEYNRVEFPTDDSDGDPPVDRYLIEDGEVRRIDQSDHVPLPVFLSTEWEILTLTVTAGNHEDLDREFEVSGPTEVPPTVDEVQFDVVFDDGDSVQSFKPF